MIITKHLTGLASGILISLSVSAVAAGTIENYSNVTQERLNNPEDHNWLQWRGNYEGWGYSPLDQIGPANVANLQPVWKVSTGVVEGHQAPPIVNNGVMFVTTPMNQVLALDAKTGALLWRYQHEIPDELGQFHPTNRGVALWGDKVYLAAYDAVVIAIDAKTGKEVWQTAVEDWETGYYLTLAPLAVNGKIIVGTSGGEYGIRGFIAAYDAETGNQVWKRHTIPGPGEPGHDTWSGDTWLTGGAPAWLTGNYDEQSNTLFWGTGNAAPWMPDNRAGDNLWANSVLAINADTGELIAGHQYHYNGAWDWDEVSAPVIMPVTRGDRTFKGLVHAGRSGILWVLEANADGSMKFIDAESYVYQDVFTSIDPKTGRPSYDESKIPHIGVKADFCPSTTGGKNWPPAAYSPKTGLFYIPANENLCGSLIGKAEEYIPGQPYLTTTIADIGLAPREGADHIGEVQAWNMDTREKTWQHNFQHHNWGPLTATGGNLVFGGGTNDRYFRAFDAKTGEVLWQFRTNSGITAVPSSYAVDGKQYIAVQAGWGVDAQRVQDKLDEFYGSKTEVPQGGMIWVFALPDEG